MPIQYQTDGDIGFTGVNSRENPATLKKGELSISENFRLNRGIATVRKGLKRLFFRDIDPENNPVLRKTLRHVTTFKNQKGEDLVVFICRTGLFTYNVTKNSLSISREIPYPDGAAIDAKDECDAFQALDKLYILRGPGKKPLVWDGFFRIDLGPKGFPSASHGVYHSNRAVVQISKDEISVSRYLDFDTFRLLDVFKINDGSNDEIIAIAPWVLNELVIFCKNKIYYGSVGAGAYARMDQVVQEDCYVKVLAADIGCTARRTIVQADGGIFFLSDYGVYHLKPNAGAGTTSEGMRVGVLGEPISAPIEDVMLRINQDHVRKAVAAYHNNRYYIALPINGLDYEIGGGGGGGGGSGGGNNNCNDASSSWWDWCKNAWNDDCDPPSEYWLPNQCNIVNIKVPYSIGSEFQKGDSIFVDKIEYTDLNDNTVGIVGTFTVDSTYVSPDNTQVLISFVVPFFHSSVDTVIDPELFTIRKVTQGNNCILIYNFINKSWETIDNFDANVDIAALVFGFKAGSRRLYLIDRKKGAFQMEEVKDGDEFGVSLGNPILNNVYLPFLLEDTYYERKASRGRLITRSYNFGSLDDKRYSSAELDIVSPTGGKVRTSVITENPDLISQIDYFESDRQNGYSRDVPICKFATNAKIMVETFAEAPSIRSIDISAVDPGNNTKSSS